MIDAHCNLGTASTFTATPRDLLSEMDRNQVDEAVVATVDAFLAVYNREGNDQVLAAAREHADRFIPFTTANPWYGEKAVEDLDRTFAEGAAGLKLHPRMQGFRITDPIVRPLVELCIDRGRPIYFHTGTPIASMPYQLNELAMQYPEATLIMGRMAWSDFWNDVPYACRGVDNIFLETSHHVPHFIGRCMAELGSGRMVYGSDWPIQCMDLEIEKIRRYVPHEEDRANLFGRTLARILGRQRLVFGIMESGYCHLQPPLLRHLCSG